MAQFPVEEWEQAGEPYLKTAGWCKMCIRIAENNPAHMKDIFTIAKNALANDANGSTVSSRVASPPESVTFHRMVIRTDDATSIAGHSTAAPASSTGLNDIDTDEELDSDLEHV